MVRFNEVHKSFGKKKVLKGIDLLMDKPGHISAILGPNGSGKTTLIKIFLGMVLPDAGAIYFRDESIAHQYEYRNHIDYLPQIARFPENLTTRELIDMVRTIRKKSDRAQELIRRFDLTSYLDTRLRNLSGGTRQKVNLTLALMYDSPLVILDEPTSGLDPVALLEFRKLLKEEKAKGKIILITTHIMSFVESIADEIIFILDGVVYFQGSPVAIKEKYQEETLEAAIAILLTESTEPADQPESSQLVTDPKTSEQTFPA